MFPSRALATAILAWIVTACATSPVAREAALAAERIPLDRSVVVVPTRAPEWLEVPEDTLAALDSLIVSRLRSIAQPLIEPEVYTAAWDSILRGYEVLRYASAGPIPPDRIQRARERLIESLKKDHRAAVLIYPELVQSYAEWEGSKANWDGVSQNIDGKSDGWGLFGSFLAILLGEEPEEEPKETGMVSALSLVIYVQNLEGEDIYVHRGGIELLSRYEDGKFVMIEQGILDDPRHRSKAVAIALGPLVDAIEKRRKGIQ